MPRGKGENIAVGKDNLIVIILPACLLEHFVSSEDLLFSRSTDLSAKRFQPLYPVVKNEGQQLLSIPSEPWKGSQPFPFSTLSPLCYQG